MPKVMAAANASYTLPTISDTGGGCIDDTWTATSTNNAPDGRLFPSGVWTGTEMIVWGGINGESFLNTGGRYNPSTDSWTATNTTNAPDGRSVHTAVWTGSEMIIWGGENSGPGGLQCLNSGGRYNPGTDSWMATSATNVPSPRSSHTAVWTGGEMIVWGGWNCYGDFLNTGGRYNPSTDSWTATSINNAPDGRYEQTAVWTGGEMIVWGGVGNCPGSGFCNSGGQYNPGTDSWTATSFTNAPTARAAHTAVWSGSEMIVWAGYEYDSDSDVNTGGRYNPVTDSWIATSITNAPYGRIFHSAVWTGNEMIIWGGHDTDFDPLHTGGRYNPVTDSWTLTSIIDAPSAREGHAAAWTGREMIVWGGAAGGYYFNSGGRYCAQFPPPTPTPTPTGTPSCMPAWQNEPPMANARRWPVTAVVGSNLYAITGFNDATRQYTDVNERFDGNNWTTLTPIIVRQNFGSAAVVDTNIYVPGGWNVDPPYYGELNTMQIYSTTTNTWSMGNPLPAPRAGVATAAFNGLVYVIAGFTRGGDHNDVYIYDPVSNTYTTGAPMPASNGEVAGVLFNGEIYVVGGGTRPGAHYAYNPTSNAWRTIAAMPTDTCESGNGFVLGNELWITGCVGEGINSQVWIYNPGADMWRAGPQYNVDHQAAGAALLNGRGFVVGGGTAANPSTAVESIGSCPGGTPTPTATASPTATATPTGSPACTPIVIPGSITTNDPTQTGRIFRDDPPSTCAAPQTCSVADTTPRHYSSSSFTNTTGSNHCVTVTLDPMTCTGNNALQSAVYLGSFDPANVCANYLADIGNSPDVAKSYSFTVPAGQTFVVTVNEVTANAGCAGYTLRITGICDTATPTPSPTATATPAPSSTVTPSATVTPTSTATVTPTPTPTAAQSPTPPPRVTPTPRSRPTPRPRPTPR
jgi:N-acetylneuraminic acid mutarotase